MLGEFVTDRQYAALLERGGKTAAPMLAFEPAGFDACYNRKPFLVGHRLAGHPQFALPRLFALCRRLPPEQLLFRVGNIPGDTELETSYDRYRRGLTLDEVLERFEENQAYLCINNPERDAEYAPLIEGLLAEVAARTDALDPGMSWYSSYVFVSAHDSVTPYHMDREMNFLLQIQGTKKVFLWDPADDEVMSPAQKDFLLAHVGSRPRYRPALEEKAMAFELRPGLGVHHPFIAPHRVHTGAALSVSLALTFRTRRSDMWTDAHRFNARLRHLGLRPGPVGRNALLDRAKSEIARAGQRVHRTLAPTAPDAP
ncbi:transcription factor jumonji JmjC domain-containing protein [Frateuria sp. Soil773]|uniref:cupin-like domain-containing protein n=1 Tax=Frateuria sp. Soil773 TaxID=1736407 RepID=UPI0006F67B1E|nr:cupin-like domain-containing protein [Frateuria sp. Soil773]KRF02126.1 transcription factor jumonji JmjC domain-containing protein [Frateuria sp. Soil773]